MSFFDPQNPGIGFSGQLTNAEVLLVEQISALGDPNINAVLGWDDTDNAYKFFAIGTGLAYTHSTHTLSSTGVVSSITIASANGFAGSSSGGATPVLTLSTSITGILKGNGTAISAGSASDVDSILPTQTGNSGKFLTTNGSISSWTTVGGSGTVTNTGGNLTANAIVLGAGTVDTKVVAGIITDGVSIITLGVNTTTAGKVKMFGATSGDVTLVPTAVAGTSTTITLPASTDTLVGRATTDTLTNKTLTSPVLTTPTLGVATATSINGLTITSSTGTLTITNLKVLSVSNTLTFTGTDGTSFAFPSTSDTVVTLTATQTLTNKTLTTPTLTTPVINGTATGTGVSATPAASIISMWDANKNLSANLLIEGFTTTATAAGTTTLTIASTGIQVFTGVTTQIVKLPTTSVVAGSQYIVINQSTGAVTVQSSGANTITILAANTSATFTAVVATPTTAANWNAQYFADIVTSGKSLSVSNTLTLAGTDGTTMTFPSTSDTVVTLTATQTLTNKTLTSPTISGPTFSGSLIGTYTIAGTPTFPSAVVQLTSTQTLTNKRIDPRVTSTASSSTPAPDFSTTDVYILTALAVGATFTNPAGTPVNGDKLIVRIKDNGTAQTLAFGTQYRGSSDLALPTTTILGKVLYMGFMWNNDDTKLDLIALLNNF